MQIEPTAAKGSKKKRAPVKKLGSKKAGAGRKGGAKVVVKRSTGAQVRCSPA